MPLSPVKDFLRDVIGLDSETIGTSIVESAIKKHMTVLATDSVASYLSSIKSSPERTKELIELAVINETWFFRQPEAFTYLRTVALEKRKQLSTRKRLRILCLGCSTGEEPFSIAMMLQDGLVP